MKKLNVLLFILAISTLLLGSLQHANATIITVCNGPDVADYTDLQEAIDNASPGDSLYVCGSGVSYGDIDIDKQLYLIGAGIYPDKEYNIPSKINDIDFTINESTQQMEAHGTVMDGFHITYFTAYIDISGLGNFDVNDLVVSNCFLAQSTNLRGNNIIIKNNVFSSGLYNRLDNLSNFEVSNNVFLNAGVLYAKGTNINIVNNLFVDSDYTGNFLGSSGSSTNRIEGAVIRNNIFYGADDNISVINSHFENNIAYKNGGDFLNIDFTSGSNNTATGNIIADPMFTNPVIVNSGDPLNDNDYLNGIVDYSLQTGSPALNAGTDGTDIGSTGGTNPFQMRGEPGIPQVRSITLDNNEVVPGQTLQINVVSTRDNY